MKIKRNKKSYKWFLCGLILVVVLTITYKVSKANYRISNSIELTTGKVVSSPYDFNIVSMYIDGVEQDKGTIMPQSGYAINEENSYCYKENKNNKDTNAILYTDELGNHVFSGISQGSKCLLYFDEIDNTISDKCGSACQYILSKVDSINIRRRTYKTFNIPYVDTNNYIYKALDNDGISYYFAGNPSNNWVEFGGYYWRIIRINGDGSIRMIYQGKETNINGKETQINGSTYAFNSSNNDNAYIGYFYTLGELRGLETPSNAYTELNNWFKSSNIKQGSSYFNLIDPNAGFCGDRTSYIENTLGSSLGGGTGTTATFYGAYLRLHPEGSKPSVSSTTVTPTYNCVDNNDLYTYTEANQGNKMLENPVGMITADEVAYAGMVVLNSSSGNYLDTDLHYWTMTPYNYSSSHSGRVFAVWSTGNLSSGGVHGTLSFGIRPVINLRSDVTFTGNGTQSNPYKVVMP